MNVNYIISPIYTVIVLLFFCFVFFFGGGRVEYVHCSYFYRVFK